jgi:putative (di)nucleoside polyphosphate hydrolase
MLRLCGTETDVCLDHCAQPEFDHWTWLDYWEPVRRVVFFKRRVYDRALTQLAPLIFPEAPPVRPQYEAPPRPRRRRRG